MELNAAKKIHFMHFMCTVTSSTHILSSFCQGTLGSKMLIVLTYFSRSKIYFLIQNCVALDFFMGRITFANEFLSLGILLTVRVVHL